jgi:hypothetical protein
VRRPLAIVTTAVLLLAGCGGGSSRTTASDTTTTKAATGPTAPAPVKPGAPARAVAGMGGTIDGKSARLDILSLTRSGGVSQLTMRVANTDTTAGGAGLQIANTFDDGVNGTPTTPNVSFTLDGVSLIDAVNRKKYMVARDSKGVCVCDGDLSGTFVKAGQSVNLSATFGAPPPDVRTVNVFVPKFGTFRGVPLS